MDYNQFFKYFWPFVFGSFALVTGIYFIREDPAKLPVPITFFLSYFIYIAVNKHIKQAEVTYAPTTLFEYVLTNNGWFVIFLLFFIIIKGYVVLKLYLLAVIILIGIFSTLSILRHYKNEPR